MRLICLYFKTVFMPEMEAAWFIIICETFFFLLQIKARLCAFPGELSDIIKRIITLLRKLTQEKVGKKEHFPI